jgi:hypothetical protein
MTPTPFEDLFPSLPRIDRDWEQRKQRLIALSPEERVVAMRAGRLSYRELCYWSAVRPDEVPRITTGDSAGGEFEWLAAFIPEIAETHERQSQPSRRSRRSHR